MQKVAWITFFVGISILLNAQDHHPWAQQFGARATFLGGAVIAGLEDNSSIYYNPGAFAFIEESNLQINTDVYKYGDAIMRDGAGDGIDVISRRLSLYPQMVSGLITRKPEKPYRIGFAIITRHHANLDFNQRVDMLYDVVEENPGDEYYLGNIDIQNQMSENWAGICYSRKVGNGWGLGATAYLSYRNQRYLYSQSALTAWNDSLGVSRVASFRYYDAVRVNTIRSFVKLGLSYRRNGWRFGLTYTSPTLSIWGESRVQRELAYFGLSNYQADATYSDQQKRVPTVVRQPHSMGLGVFHEMGKVNMGFSMEYYNSLALYRMVKAEEREVVYPLSLSDGPTDFLGFYHFSNQVLNFALGIEWWFTKRWQLHASIRTDFSTLRRLPPDLRIAVIEKPQLIYPAIDLYHGAMGVSFHRNSATLSFGLSYGYGFANEVRQLVDFASPKFPNQILGNVDDTARLSSNSLSILVGYTYFFALLK
jgi:hypothetical protein